MRPPLLTQPQILNTIMMCAEKKYIRSLVVQSWQWGFSHMNSVHLTLDCDSHLWQLAVNSGGPRVTLQLHFSPSSPLHVSRFGRDSGLHILCMCLSVLVPGQQKQEKSLDTDVKQHL